MRRSLLTAVLLIASVARAEGPPAPAPPSPAEVLRKILRNNDGFVSTHDGTYFAPFRDQQHPLATVVGCSDSRFHTPALDEHADGEIFVVRNIGNQLDLAAGSVAYGIRHLHTPVLLIAGHVQCGAVKAAMADYSAEPASIRRELNGLHLSIAKAAPGGNADERWRASVMANVHQQVADALQEFGEEVRSGTLLIVGAVYDFRDELGKGAGRLVVVNVNGETDAARIAANPIMKSALAAGH
jgi:carbonic anhydrase